MSSVPLPTLVALAPEPADPPGVAAILPSAAASAGHHPQGYDYLTAFLPHGAVDPAPQCGYHLSPHGWRIGHHPELTPELMRYLEEGLVARKSTAFAYSLADLPGYSGLDGPLKIPLRHGEPIFQQPRRYTPAEEAIRDEKCAELRDAGIIERASHDCKYASRPTMPAKKDADGNWSDHRFCNDYRRLNDGSEPDRYALHNADDMLRQVATGRYFSKLDMRQAFLQIPITPEDRPKTAFWWRNELWQYNRMPYGLVSGSAKCQRVMDTELAAAGLAGCAKSFVDDVACWTAEGGLRGHIDRLFELLDALGKVNLRCHPNKCCFVMPEMELLGHQVSTAGISPHESKVVAIRVLTPPANLAELRSKVAFINYYRHFIPHFSAIAAPLNELLRKGVPWVWGPAQEQAFGRLKEVVCTPGVVLRPFDPVLPTVLYTDWSKVGIAAVLHQLSADKLEHLVACLSRSLNVHERNYSSYEGECLAAVWGVKSFRQYLHGTSFRLITDHQPLKWLMQNQELSGKHMRWALILQEYTFTVEHRAGTAHVNADVPSRFPCPATFDSTGACLDPEQPPLAGASPAACLAAHPSAFSIISEPAACTSFPLDVLLPTGQDLFELPPASAGDGCSLAAAGAAAGLASAAARWVAAAEVLLEQVEARAQPIVLGPGSADLFGARPTVQLCTSTVGPALFSAGRGEGVWLCELFGGLCAGLDAVLTCGLRVAQYYYCDIDMGAQAVARSRVQQLHAKYPHLFPAAASVGAFTTISMDVRCVNSAQLHRAGATGGQQWLVVAGWSCEDLSPAGKGAGLAGARSSNFFDAVRIVGALQQMQQGRPPAFIMENTAMQVQFAHTAVRETDFPRVCSILGEPVLLDAAQVGSYAHRLRNYWSNIVPAEQVRLVLDQVRRAPGRVVDAVLDPGRRCQPVAQVQQAPFFSCNQLGQTPCVLPTLVAYPASRAFRDGRAGMVRVVATGQLQEPNPDERERILGYPTGCTAAEGVSQAQRHAITGRAMDRHAMVHLVAVYMALSDRLLRGSGVLSEAEQLQCSAVDAGLYSQQAVSMLEGWGWQRGGPLLSPSASAAIVEPMGLVGNVGTRGLGYSEGAGQLAGQATAAVAQLCQQFSQGVNLWEGTAGGSQLTSAVYSDAEVHEHYCGLSALAAGQDEGDKPAGSGKADPHVDRGLMHFLSHGTVPVRVKPQEAARIRIRGKRYRLVDGQLQRRMGDGSHRVVPPGDQRVDLVRQTHERTGHFGVKRTKHLLLASFWWPGLEADVVRVLAACEPCARIKATFNAERPQLQPLPIEGLFYRWGVDMAGPFAKSADGNQFVVIMVEHLSKQVELVAVPGKLARTNAYAFLSAVLSRYGAPAEVLTDRGTEFEGEFHQLLVDCLIDHRTTSPNHPQADGLAERVVQTVKKALAKHVAQHLQLGDWDWELLWIGLGYRASRQAATGCSPYELLYGALPIIPPAIRQRVLEPALEFSNADQAAEYLLQRAQLLRRNCTIAMNNLRIAQHRDSLRYQQVRSGNYMPVTVKFEPGDFVYVRRRTVVNSLQSEAKPGIYRVAAVLPSGVLVLQGRCGSTMKVNVAECAPCHLTNINPVMDPRLQHVPEGFPCQQCGSAADEAVMVICDGCFQGFHIYCLQPPLAAVPSEEVWLCDECKQQGLDAQVVSVLRQQNLPVAESDAPVFPSVQQRAHDAAAQQLQGRVVWMSEGPTGAWQKGTLMYVPRVDRKEHSRSPLCMVVEDGQPVHLSLRKAQRLLQAGPPPGVGAPLGQSLASVFVAAADMAKPQPAQLRLDGLHSEQQVAHALEEWCEAMPSAAVVAASWQAIRGMDQEAVGAEWPCTVSQVQALVQAVDLRVCTKLSVAGGTSSAVLEVLKQRYGKALWALDKVPGKAGDSLSVRWYKRAHVRVPLDCVFVHPPAGLEELVLGLAVQQARKVVVMLVASSRLTNLSSTLAVMLQRWEEQGRLVCVTCDSSREAWVVVFASPHWEQAMVSVRGKVHGTGWALGGWVL